MSVNSTSKYSKTLSLYSHGESKGKLQSSKDLGDLQLKIPGPSEAFLRKNPKGLYSPWVH